MRTRLSGHRARDRNSGCSGREKAQSSPPGRPLPPPQGARVRLDAAPAPLPPRKPTERRSPCDGIAVKPKTAHWPLGQLLLPCFTLGDSTSLSPNATFVFCCSNVYQLKYISDFCFSKI